MFTVSRNLCSNPQVLPAFLTKRRLCVKKDMTCVLLSTTQAASTQEHAPMWPALCTHRQYRNHHTPTQLHTQKTPRLPTHPVCTHLSSWPFYHTQIHHPSPLTEAISILSSHRDMHHLLAFHMLTFLPEYEALRAGTHQVCYSVPRSQDSSLIHKLSVTQ